MTLGPTKDHIELAVNAFSKDGFGVADRGRSDGVRDQVEIPFTMPGDRVLASLGRRRRGRVSGRLEQIVEASPDRVRARCAHFGVCGGCRWQHVPYAQQLRLKETKVHQAFAALIQSYTRLCPIALCDPPWTYRNKMEFSFSSDVRGERYLGLVMQGGRGRVFHLMECHLVQPWMAELLAATRTWWSDFGLAAYHPRSNSGSLRTLMLRQGISTHDRLVMLTVSGNADFALSKEPVAAFKEMLVRDFTPTHPGSHLSIVLRIQQIAKGHRTQFYEMMLHGPDSIHERLEIQAIAGSSSRQLLLKVGPSAFFQPNPRQAEKLYSLALQNVALSSEDVIYDLCCGTGSIGISAAPYVRQVVGIERSPEAAIDARVNAAANSCDNVVIHTGDVGQVLARLRQEGTLQPAQVVIVDPPRSGLTAEAVQQILQLKPRQILYISCNPHTQAVDAAQLCHAGYRLDLLQPVDQFPQTIHTENIAVFGRVQE